MHNVTIHPKTINVVIVDDHPLVLQGFKTALSAQSDMSVVAAYKNAKELLDGLTHKVPDILLLDIQLPDIPGDELAPSLLKDYPDMKILVLTNFDSTMYISKMHWIGVHGYFLKTTEEEVLIEAIRTIHNGGQFMDEQIKAAIEKAPLKSAKVLAGKTSLTTREKQVLQMIANGFTDQKIAESLFLSQNTIRHYRLTLLLKLDVNNTAAMVSKALKTGLIH